MSNQKPTRVNIQFSIDLEELPSEIDRLIEKSNQHIASAKEFYSKLSSNDNNLTTEGYEGIDNIRRSLSKSDQVLDDLQKIISGYLSMKSQNFSAPAPAPEPEMHHAPEAEFQSPFLENHPDATKTGRPAPFSNKNKDLKDMQSQMMQVMAQMQQKMDNDDMTAEEQEAADILKNRLARVMGTGDENSSETGS